MSITSPENSTGGKVAILWPGTLRYASHLLSYYRCCIEAPLHRAGYETHLYCSTYAGHEVSDFVSSYKPYRIDIEEKNIVEGKVRGRIESIEFHNRWPETNHVACTAMFYKLARCYSMLEADYDYVVRYRDKIWLGKELQPATFRQDTVQIPAKGDWRGGLCDTFAVGSMKHMRHYCCFVQMFLEKMIEEGCFFHPENLMLWSMLKSGAKLERIDTDVFLYSPDSVPYLYTQTNYA